MDEIGRNWFRGSRDDCTRGQGAQTEHECSDAELHEYLLESESNIDQKCGWGLTTGVQRLARASLRVLTHAGLVTVSCNGMLGIARFSGPLSRGDEELDVQ
jgi:hypothetical protein